MAEGVRFELTRPFGLPVFKTGAFNRSATPPKENLGRENCAIATRLGKGGSSSPLLDVKSGGGAAKIWHRPAERPIHQTNSTSRYVHVNLSSCARLARRS